MSVTQRVGRPRQGAVIAMATVLAFAGIDAARAVGFTQDFRLEECSWSSRGGQNPYFSLRPGHIIVLEGEEDGALIRQEIEVLRATETIRFVTPSGLELMVRARVIEERETEDGELVEVSRNWFARCRETSDIYYFGEDVDDYEDGEIVGHEGAWRAGEGGAQPGIIMPGTFLLGAKYYQEIAPGVALDRTRHVAMRLEVATPVGTFTRCVATVDSSALSPGPGDPKVYCPGVGIVIDDVISIVELDRPDAR